MEGDITEKNKFEKRDIITEKSEEKFNLIIAFEVVEHVPDSKAFLESCVSMLDEDGTTTPNENILNFYPDMFKFHQRYYTLKQFQEKVSSVGLEVLRMYSQNDERIFKTDENAFNVFVCKKKDSTAKLPEAFEVEVTGVEKAASRINRLDWYVKHAPRMDYEVYCGYLSDIYVTLADMFRCEKVIGTLKPMTSISQTIIAKASNLCGIAICTATYCKEFK